MASIKFIKILNAAKQANVYDMSIEAANRWFQFATAKYRRRRTRVEDIEVINPPQAAAFLKRVLVGNLYYFTYIPKNRLKLKYYDEFPLVMPIELDSTGFTGINFHYLPPMERALLMDRMTDMFRNPNDPERVLNRNRLSYSVLDGLGNRYKYYKPAFKKYLFGQIYGRLIELEEEEWKTALFLPVHRFVGASARQVWQESRKQYRGK